MDGVKRLNSDPDQDDEIMNETKNFLEKMDSLDRERKESQEATEEVVVAEINHHVEEEAGDGEEVGERNGWKLVGGEWVEEKEGMGGKDGDEEKDGWELINGEWMMKKDETVEKVDRVESLHLIMEDGVWVTMEEEKKD